jgi:hypothetical protein
MPGAQFRAFAKVVRSNDGNCFSRFSWGNASVPTRQRRNKKQDGHLCYQPLARALPEPPGFLVSSWRPNRSSREEGPLCHALSSKETGEK